MTDYSKMTDEQVNEAIAVKCGWKIQDIVINSRLVINEAISPYGLHCVYPDELPDYTHDWRLCGELLEEMKDADVSLYYQNSNFRWGIGWRDECGSHHNLFADTPQRAICEAWLAWKEQG